MAEAKITKRSDDYSRWYTDVIAAAELAEYAPVKGCMVIRPTSKTIVWNTYGSWMQSCRDLPLLINQWCSVGRWEMRTRLFLRTTEFLWQEGHTAHATYEDGEEEAVRMLGVYRRFSEEY